jgi:hypothetical protein
MQKIMDMKERIGAPLGWSLLGAILGTCAGALLMRKAFSVSEERARRMGTLGSSTMGYIGTSEGLMSAERPGLVGSDRSDTLASPTGSRIPPVPPLDDLATASGAPPTPGRGWRG